ncbi:MAG: DUF1343 domain-containing protein [Nitrospirae bacterium]|nr:DUF1343 domain-containing protein [Nitrospirota bacterium]
MKTLSPTLILVLMLSYIPVTSFFPLTTSLWASGTSAASPVLDEEHLNSIDDVVGQAINDGRIPGAVVVIGNKDGVVYRKAFGYRCLVPDKIPMTVDTIFDLSSVTKVIATTTAVMQLVERGKLRLEDPVAKYWHEFAYSGKGNITVRQLLTHYSGLRPDLDVQTRWYGYDTALKMIIAEKPVYPPGTRFVYSDINFEVLGELVRRISGQPLDVYCAQHIFKPLGMTDTGFKPAPELRNRIAPTTFRKGRMLQGQVHDPTAYYMGGVAGHAGLFSTAGDVALFARMLLDGGSIGSVRILSPLMVEKMSSPQTPPGKTALRGLGWDIDSPFASTRGVLFPVGSYGHSGFTGTSIWIDPVSETYVIILTNRVHPDEKGDAVSLRSEISTIVASSLEQSPAGRILTSHRTLTSYYELLSSYSAKDLRNRGSGNGSVNNGSLHNGSFRNWGLRNGNVKTGIDVLASEKFKSLSGLSVGLITNHSGQDSAGHRSVDLLYNARGVKLRALFSPEHGFYGDYDEISSKVLIYDTKTGLPVYNLYGKTNRPAPEMLDGLDALVFDIQDAGVRFYTYITTMGYAMEAAAKKGIAFYVLDRPNPITGNLIQGPIVGSNLRSFTNYFPLPVRHGMTIGELAEMFNAEYKIGAKLHVIKMQGYERTDWYDETGLTWVNPSPNIRSLTGATLYPGVAMVEGANVSVGRGTGMPFEVMGAPWIQAKRLAAYLNDRRVEGVRFIPVDFTPSDSEYKNELCHGVQIVVIDRRELDCPALGVEIASALYHLFQKEFNIDSTRGLIGDNALQGIKDNHDPQSIVTQWQTQLDQFQKLRSKYLLY